MNQRKFCPIVLQENFSKISLFQILDLGLCQLTESGLKSVKLPGQILNAIILQLNQIVQEIYLQKIGFKITIFLLKISR